MFNLFRSKGKTAKILLTGIFVMVGISMLWYLVPNGPGSDTTGANAVLIQAGNAKLTSVEAEQEFQQTMKEQRDVPPAMQGYYFTQWFDSRKQRMAVLEAARQMGITVTNEEIGETLAQFGPFAEFFENGKLINREGFEAAVLQRGLTVDRVLREVQEGLLYTKLEEPVLRTTVVTPAEVEKAYRERYERISVDYVAFSPEAVYAEAVVTDKEIQERYEATKVSYQQGEKYAFRVVVLQRYVVEEGVKVSEEDLRSAYTASVDRYRIPEQVHARHILLMTEGKSDSEKKTQRQKAEEALKKLKGGADFEKVAEEYSDDTAHDLGTFERGGREEAISNAAFGQKENGLSGIVTSKYGFHIVQTLKKIPARITPFETVRASIEEALRQDKLYGAMETAVSRMQADIKKDPANAGEAARKAGAEVITVTEAPKGGAIPGLGVSPEIDAVLGLLKPGNTSDPVTLPGERVAVVILDKVIPQRQSTLAEVHDELAGVMRTEKARELIGKRSNEAAERLKEGEDIHTVAKDLKTTVKVQSSFGPADDLPELGPAVYFEDGFHKGVGTVMGPALMQGLTVVAKVVAKVEADMEGLEDERKTLMASLRQKRARQNSTLWLDSIVQRYLEDGTLIVNDDEMNRLIAQLGR